MAELDALQYVAEVPGDEAPGSHAERVELLLGRLVSAVEKNTEAIREQTKTSAETATRGAQRAARGEAAAKAARGRDQAGGGRRVEER